MESLQLTLGWDGLRRIQVDRRQARDHFELGLARGEQQLERLISLGRVETHSVLNARKESDLPIPFACAHAQKAGEAPAGTLGHHLFEDYAHLLRHQASSLALIRVAPVT
jgi:hypothetical protein